MHSPLFFLLSASLLLKGLEAESITFTKEDGTDWNKTANQDVIVDGYLAITRDSMGGSIFNALVEGDHDKALYYDIGPPARTMWAYAPKDEPVTSECDFLNLQYCDFQGYDCDYSYDNLYDDYSYDESYEEPFWGFYGPSDVGRNLVLRVLRDDTDLFFNLKFTQWSDDDYYYYDEPLPGGGGGGGGGGGRRSRRRIFIHSR